MIQPYHKFTLLLCCILIISCKKTTPNIEENPITLVKTKAQQVDSLKNELEKNGHIILADSINSDSTAVKFYVSTLVDVPSEFSTYYPKNYGSSTYPDYYVGNTVNGDHYYNKSKFYTSLTRYTIKAPQNIVITAGNELKLAEGQVTTLKNAQVKSFMSTQLRNIGTEKIAENRKPITIKTGNFSKYKDINDAIFHSQYDLTNSLKPGYGTFEYQTDNEKIKKPNGTYFFFRQDYFKVAIDTSASDWALYGSAIPDTTFNKESPVYMQSITYGRYGLLAIESDVNSTTITEIVNKALANFADLTEAEKITLSQSTIQNYYLGLGEDWTFNLLQTTPLGRVQYFCDLIKKDEYSASNYGNAPTFFELFNVKDNQLFSKSTKGSTLEYQLN